MPSGGAESWASWFPLRCDRWIRPIAVPVLESANLVTLTKRRDWAASAIAVAAVIGLWDNPSACEGAGNEGCQFFRIDPAVIVTSPSSVSSSVRFAVLWGSVDTIPSNSSGCLSSKSFRASTTCFSDVPPGKSQVIQPARPLTMTPKVHRSVPSG